MTGHQYGRVVTDPDLGGIVDVRGAVVFTAMGGIGQVNGLPAGYPDQVAVTLLGQIAGTAEPFEVVLLMTVNDLGMLAGAFVSAGLVTDQAAVIAGYVRGALEASS